MTVDEGDLVWRHIMRLERLPKLIVLGTAVAAWGCGGGPAEIVEPACSFPPHSRFHPVPTGPVFHSAAAAPPLGAAPPELPIEPLDTEPDLPPPAADEPQMLPEFSSKPINYERPSSRRRQNLEH
jgi:hypothetical protein